MINDALKNEIRAVVSQADLEGRALEVYFTDGDYDIRETDGADLSDEGVVLADHLNRKIEIPYEEISELKVYMDVDETDEIVEIKEIPDGVSVRFRGGIARELLGRTIEEIEREIGRVGDRAPRRKYVGPPPTPERLSAPPFRTLTSKKRSR